MGSFGASYLGPRTFHEQYFFLSRVFVGREHDFEVHNGLGLQITKIGDTHKLFSLYSIRFPTSSDKIPTRFLRRFRRASPNPNKAVIIQKCKIRIKKYLVLKKINKNVPKILKIIKKASLLEILKK